MSFTLRPPPEASRIQSARSRVAGLKTSKASLERAINQEEASIELQAPALRPWSRWVTPEVVPIRFDTRFYVALAPPHSRPAPDLSEVDEARWLTPAAALEEHAADRLELSFPTIRHLEELAAFPDADAVLAEGAARRVEPITPKVRGDRDNFEVLLPGDPGFAEA